MQPTTATKVAFSFLFFTSNRKRSECPRKNTGNIGRVHLLHPASIASSQESCGPDEDNESDEFALFVIFVHVCLKTGFITVTNHLNIEVAVRVAATDTTAVVAAVVNTIPSGTGTSTSVYGTRTVGIGGVGGSGLGLSDSVVPLTPGGARRSLGGTTSGL